mmetsp:Transcript_29341/g.80010  ORF Transcript_29341/g.80010 Transcript_29341/m.80010 type:complete len:123 (-) Transcript_29341:415-783(-)
MGLRDVVLTVTLPSPPNTAEAVVLIGSTPEGLWDSANRQLHWREAIMQPGPPGQTRPRTFGASYRIGAGVQAMPPPIINVQFAVRGLTFTRLLPRPNANDAAVVSGSVDRSFKTGDYIVSCS